MSFLQPIMLFALPLIALPIIIHLVNQRRFQTVQWAAMKFLLAANRMSRGFARLRQYLILAARTLAIAGLIFAISRPLASGWQGLLAGGKVDTTIILLDRSPSMLEQGAGGGMSKLESGREQLVQSLGLLGSNRWVVIDSALNSPMEIESPAGLSSLPQAEGVSASADVPAMLQTAYDYIQANRPSRTELWICSDLRQNDWDSEGGRWGVLRDSLLESPHPVRIHLLAYPQVSPENRSIRVTEVRRQPTADGAELLVSLRIEQSGAVADSTEKTTVGPIASLPIEFEIDGAKSQLTVEMAGGELELKDHVIPLDSQQVRGWGRVSLPADANLADNEFYFVYDQPHPRKTLLVTDDAAAVRPLVLAASISPSPDVVASIETLSPEQVSTVLWDDVSLVMWQAPLPEGDEAGLLQGYLNRGGQIVFFPPERPTATEFAGIRWEDWQTVATESPVATWVGDQGLLANTRSGAALPVGQLTVSRYCELSGDQTALATLQGDAPLLARAVTDRQNVYFCTTTTAVTDSSLARDGIVLYVMVQRALNAGASALGTVREYIAGQVPETSVAQWRPLTGATDLLSTSYAYQSGVFQDGDRLFAINRSQAEDRSGIVSDSKVASLFERLDFDRVDDHAGSGSSLLQETWRLFLAIMMFALLAEAFLCLPRLASVSTGGAAASRGFATVSSAGTGK